MIISNQCNISKNRSHKLTHASLAMVAVCLGAIVPDWVLVQDRDLENVGILTVSGGHKAREEAIRRWDTGIGEG